MSQVQLKRKGGKWVYLCNSCGRSFVAPTETASCPECSGDWYPSPDDEDMFKASERIKEMDPRVMVAHSVNIAIDNVLNHDKEYIENNPILFLMEKLHILEMIRSGRTYEVSLGVANAFVENIRLDLLVFEEDMKK